MSRLRQVTLFGAPTSKQPRADADSVIAGVSCTSGCSDSSPKSGLHNQVPRPQVSELEVCNIIDSDTASANNQQSVHVPVTNYVAQWVSVSPSPPYVCHSPIFFNSSSDEDPGTFSGESETERYLHDDGVTLPISMTAGAMLTAAPDLPGPSNIATASVTNTTELTISSIPTLPSDIAQTAAFPPAQPKNAIFPQTKFGSSSRSFRASWYDRFKWLEYSIERDACFCYPCHIFGSTISFGISRPEASFTVIGFRNWKKATGKNGVLSRHANSISHKSSEVAWQQYKLNLQQGTSIQEWSNSNRSTKIKQN